MSDSPSPKAIRDAAVAALLAEGVRDGKIPWTEAARLIRADLRRRQTNKKLKIQVRSVEAQRVIKEYEAIGESPPKNGSNDALHADHVFPLTETDVKETLTQDDWLELLNRRGRVVCVTAAENYKLEKEEKSGKTAWAKYRAAGIDLLVADTGKPYIPPADSEAARR